MQLTLIRGPGKCRHNSWQISVKLRWLFVNMRLTMSAWAGQRLAETKCARARPTETNAADYASTGEWALRQWWCRGGGKQCSIFNAECLLKWSPFCMHCLQWVSTSGVPTVESGCCMPYFLLRWADSYQIFQDFDTRVLFTVNCHTGTEFMYFDYNSDRLSLRHGLSL